MWKFLCPKQYERDIYGIDLQDLKGRGIKGLILDLDNTLVPWNDHAVYPEVRAWIRTLKEAGFRACIVSNNDARRGKKIMEILEIPAFWRAVKPRRRTFRKAVAAMELWPSEVAVVGDQVFTDILGGNRLGLYTILVRPINKREFWGTMCMRKVERVVLMNLKRKGYLQQPD
ncbi:MAG: YqeG family HAD IIIA-type phosphatase [Firmicutes bacterium]|mgnify:CR=1 FL=1|nr:YqeG family HAD IIIA-type phosphatase [Bacillota bacterium]